MADALDKPRGLSAQAAVEQADRRRDPRAMVNLDAEIQESATGARSKGRVTDLGLGGCYVDMMAVFPLGARVIVRMAREGEIFQADADVKYSKQGLGMGLAFTELTEEKQSQLIGWANEISVKKPAESPERTIPLSNSRVVTGGAFEPGALQLLIKILTRKGMLTQAEVEQILRELMRNPSRL